MRVQLLPISEKFRFSHPLHFQSYGKSLLQVVD
jgi:hypothetical protein